MLTQELNGLSSIEKSVIVRQSDGHDRSNDNLSLDDNGSVGDVVHT